MSLQEHFGTVSSETKKLGSQYFTNLAYISFLKNDKKSYFDLFFYVLTQNTHEKTKKSAEILMTCDYDVRNSMDLVEKFFNFPNNCNQLIADYVNIEENKKCFVEPLSVAMSLNQCSLSYEFINTYSYSGIPTIVFIEFCSIFNLRMSWKIDQTYYFSGKIKIDGLYSCYINGDSSFMQMFYPSHLNNIEEFVHYSKSCDKSIETLNASIEEVVKSQVSEYIGFSKEGLSRGLASCSQWELAQTLYVLAKKKFNQKHKNLHCSKKPGLKKKAEQLLDDVVKIQHYFMRDFAVYLNQNDHVSLKLVEEKIIVEEKITKKVPMPSIFEKRRKKNETTFGKIDSLKEFGELKVYKDQVIDMEVVEHFFKEKKINGDHNKNTFVGMLERFKLGKIVENRGRLVPAVLWDFDFRSLYPDLELHYDEYYKLFAKDADIFFKEKPGEFKPEELENCLDMNFNQMEEYLIKIRGSMSSSMKKKKLSILKKEVAKYKESCGILEYVEIPQPDKIVTEILKKEITKKVLKPYKKYLEIESENKQKTFTAHFFEPVESIEARDYKFLYSKLRSKITNYGVLENLDSLRNGIRNCSSKIRRLLKNGGYYRHKSELDKINDKKRKITDMFLQKFKKFKDTLTIDTFYGVGDPDFNKYDFENINLIKRDILIKRMCWTDHTNNDNKKNKIKAPRKLKSLMQCISYLKK
jgi:hypothetical protein